MFKSSILAALVGLTAQVYGQISTVCPSSKICYGINIPSNTASSGNGDVFFRITAPSSLQWVALGQGSSMSGAQIFVIYSSADGKNVTLSPRLGSGHVEPSFSSSAQVTLLEGSGISSGQMVANVRCSNCQSWSGGSMDFKATSGNWIHASLSGSAVNSDDTSADISQHGDDYGAFTWSWTSGKGGSSVNPFLSSSTTSTGATTSSTCTPGPTSTASCDDSSTSSLIPLGSGPVSKTMLMAHGILAALAFVVFFPFGAISIRLFSFSGIVWFHAAFQTLAYLLYIAGFGVGVYIANQMNYMDNHHPIIGMVCFVLLFFQPILGFLHHASFKKINGRGMWSYAHLWLGRGVITLGIINGGLGLKLADNSKSGKIAYAVVAAVIWLVWVAAAVWGEVKRGKTPPKYSSPVQSHRDISGEHARASHPEYYPPPKRN